MLFVPSRIGISGTWLDLTRTYQACMLSTARETLDIEPRYRGMSCLRSVRLDVDELIVLDNLAFPQHYREQPL